jgi:hypothetical protein
LQLSPLGLTAWFLADRLLVDYESGHRSVNSPETSDPSLVFDDFELTNSSYAPEH